MEQHLPFHQQLRHERELRGWSQADLASRVGSDVKTVNRWESGKSLPRPYFRQAFCELFGKNAEELGLVRKHASRIKAPLSTTQTTFPSSRQEDMHDFIHHKTSRADWGETPDVSKFYGRDRELDVLERWIEVDRCRIVAILGVGGVGKTALTVKLAAQIKDAFEYVFWRSLQNAPPLEHILKNCIQFLSDQQLADLPESVNDQITLLIQYLRDHRCLIVLDNAESLLKPGQRVGRYREGYESYGTLVQRLGEAQHMSCLMLTSREKPKEVTRQEGKASPVRSLNIAGVRYTEGRELLKDKDLFGSNEQWATLVNLYSGNPLALKLVSESIQGIFGGDIARFLEEEEIAFGDINDLLDQQFQRLSIQEQQILYWLAIERETVSLEHIRENFVQLLAKGALLEALESLQRRSLIETRGTAEFTLQPVIMEYVTNKITKQAYEEFTGVAGTTVETWTNYAFMTAQAKDYVRDSQECLILSPIAEQGLNTLGMEGIAQKLRRFLSTQRQVQPQQHSYLAANALNLLIHIHYDLRGFDFSFLMLRQAYLQNVALPEVSFANAHFAASVFINTFGNILSVAFSPDGNLLATGTATGDIWIYQVKSGSPVLTCHGHTDGVWSVVFSPDGRILISSSDDQTIRLWDTSTGDCLKTLLDHTNRVRAVTISPDGQTLASGSDDQTILLWNIDTGHCFKTLKAHTDRVWSVAFSPDGNILASGSNDQTIRLWDVNTSHNLKTLQGHSSWVRSIAFSPGGRILASGSNDHTARLWDLNTSLCLKTLQGHTSRVWSVSFNPDGNILASGSEDESIRLWDVGTGQCLKVLQGHTHGTRTVSFSSDRRKLASGGDDQAIRLWDVNTGHCLKTLQGYAGRVWSVSLNFSGTILASCSEDQTIRLWNVVTGTCFKKAQDRTHGARSIAFSPDGSILASGGEDQAIRLWGVSNDQNFKALKTLQGHTNWVRSVAFSPNGRTLASGGEDTTVRLWDVNTGHCLKTLQGHSSWIRSVAFSSDGKILASGSDDQTIRLWRLKSGHCLHILQGHTGRVRSVAFSPDGKMLASSSEDWSVRLWDTSSGHCFKTLQGHSGWAMSIAFSPDGKMLASGSDDQTIRLWDTSSGFCLEILRDHSNRVRSVAFCSDGYTLASSSDDGTIKLWNIQTGDCINTLISERPYERMNITGVKGLTEVQKAALKTLGAIEDEGSTPL